MWKSPQDVVVDSRGAYFFKKKKKKNIYYAAHRKTDTHIYTPLARKKKIFIPQQPFTRKLIHF